MEDPLNRAIEALEALPADPQQAEVFDGAIEDLLGSSQLLAASVRLPKKISKVAVENFGAELFSRAQDLKAETEAITTRLQELSEELERLEAEGKENFGQRRSDLQGEFDRVAEAVKTEQGRLDQLVPQFEKQFTDAQAGWNEEWQETKKRLEEKAASEEEKLQNNVSETASSLSEQADAALNEVRSVRDKVVDLYRVIGDTGTAGAFAAEADDQKKAADRWRRVAVAGALLTIALAIAAVFFSAIDDGGSATSHLASLVVAAAAGGLTAYAARQSGHHRDREDETRRLELELTAFGPFVNDLEHPGEARAAYAKRLFKGAERQPNGETAIGKDQVTLLQTLVESLIKVRG
jgi:predicted transcriptional regulator